MPVSISVPITELKAANPEAMAAFFARIERDVRNDEAEACAKIAESLANPWSYTIAAEIRARIAAGKADV